MIEVQGNVNNWFFIGELRKWRNAKLIENSRDYGLEGGADS